MGAGPITQDEEIVGETEAVVAMALRQPVHRDVHAQGMVASDDGSACHPEWVRPSPPDR